MGATSGSLSEYECLAIYPSEEHPDGYVHFYFSYDFDCKYQKFTGELNKTIKRDTTMSDVRATAEEIWKKHLSASK